MFGLKFLKKRTLIDVLPQVRGKYLTNVALSKHTWFGVGGPAEVLFLPEDAEDLSTFLRKKPFNIPSYIIGGGSNLLVRDGGILGVTIKFSNNNFKKISIEEGKITCGAGANNAELKKHFLANHIGGLEFLCSIPGVVGGAIKGNAGCYGKEIKDVILSVEIMDDDGQIKNVDAKDLNLSYRKSYFPDNWIILSATFKTNKDTPQNIEKILNEQKESRIKSQPYNERTAGSTFKNPEGLRAWELIKKSGCDNLEIGGAKVSE